MTKKPRIFQDNAPLVQIAGIIDEAEAKTVCECGAGSLGFPLRLAGGKEDISEKAARSIIDSLHPPTVGVVITYLDRAGEIRALCRALNATAVQLHGVLSVEELAALRRSSEDLFIIKSLIVR